MAEVVFDRQLHIKYWQRCLKSLLPHGYQSNDSSRMALAFFVLSALDILGAGPDTLPPEEVRGYRKWILGCQHPSGGFCGSPAHKYPEKYYDEDDLINIDPPNLAATYFAILSLNFVGGLEKVHRSKCLRYLKRLQREDGSFGEILGKDGKIEGGRDMRYCHFASTIRWILRGDLKAPEVEPFEDINVESLVKHIRAGEVGSAKAALRFSADFSKTYDGGIGESSEHEAHAGYTYCAIGTLSSLGRLPESVSREALGSKLTQPSGKLQRGLTNQPGLIQWLMSRQMAYADGEVRNVDHPYEAHQLAHVDDASLYEKHSDTDSGSLTILTIREPQTIAFNGRLNKPADTCYSWWGSASLEILGQGELINKDLTRRFLLEKVQHIVGGFGKEPGSPPDIYHSYLGLATLAMMKEPSLKEVDPVLPGVSLEAKNRLQESAESFLVPVHFYWKHGAGHFSPEDSPDHAEKMANADAPPKFVTVLIQPSTEGP